MLNVKINKRHLFHDHITSTNKNMMPYNAYYKAQKFGYTIVKAKQYGIKIPLKEIYDESSLLISHNLLEPYGIDLNQVPYVNHSNYVKIRFGDVKDMINPKLATQLKKEMKIQLKKENLL